MNQIVIHLPQLNITGNLNMVYLLLSGIAGYMIAWFYLKSVYRKKIKIIETDKLNLNNQLISKIITINTLNKKSLYKDSILEYLIKKIDWLKSSQKKSHHDIENKIIS
jgi:hypothetical protein